MDIHGLAMNVFDPWRMNGVHAQPMVNAWILPSMGNDPWTTNGYTCHGKSMDISANTLQWIYIMHGYLENAQNDRK